MKFSSPWNLLFLISIPLVILMYILKQKNEEKEISSIYLWEQVLKDIEVNTPWQRLKKNMLLFLQILAILFLTFSLTNPYIVMKGVRGKNLIVVIDTTGSMNARYGDTTRIEAAKKKAEDIIESSAPGSKITLISSGTHPKVEIASDEKKEVLSKLQNIKPSNSKGDISEVISLIKALSKQDNNTMAYIYTDSILDIGQIDGELISMASEVENVALEYISHTKKDGALNVMVRVSNMGTKPVSKEISLYGDGKLIDIGKVDIDGKSNKTVYFNKVPSNVSSIWAELTGKDDLLQDNIIYEVVRQLENKKVLLLTEKNIFMERALSSISNIELFKANDGDKITEKYDLYIFDGMLPKEMPKEGSIMLINPPVDSEIIKVGQDVEGGLSKVQKHSITRYMENAAFTVATMKDMEAPYWADVLIKVNDKPSIMAGDFKGRKVSIINFDFHKSDFPLTPEFPIFIYNTTGYLIETGFMEKTSYYCGEQIQITPMADAESARIKLPSGDENRMEVRYPASPFDNTNEIGIYTLIQNSKDRENKNTFAVNFPPEESKINSDAGSMINQGENHSISAYGKNIQLPLIIILFIIAVIEWVVYTRGY